MRTVRAVERAVDVLIALSDRDGRLIDVSERLKLHKATVSRLLETLARTGMVARGDNGRYTLGPRMALLGSHLLRRYRRVSDALRDPLHRVWEETGETVAVHVRVGLERLCIAELESLQRIGYRAGVGSRAPLHTGAPSKVLLAFLPDDERDAILSRLPVRGEGEARAGVSLARLKDELDRIRHRGYATSSGEYISGASAVSVPILDGHRRTVAAVSVHGPNARLTPVVLAEYAALLAREIHPLGVAIADVMSFEGDTGYGYD